jgi:hypothetical protein
MCSVLTFLKSRWCQLSGRWVEIGLMYAMSLSMSWVRKGLIVKDPTCFQSDAEKVA